MQLKLSNLVPKKQKHIATLRQKIKTATSIDQLKIAMLEVLEHVTKRHIK